MREAISKLPERTQDKMAEVAGPMIEQSKELQNDLKDHLYLLIYQY